MADPVEAVDKSFSLIEDLSKTNVELLDDKLSFQVKTNLKSIYDYCKTQEITSSKSSSLPELIIQNFEDEQIWQQLELQNDSILKNSIAKVSGLLVKKDSLVFQNEDKLVVKFEEENDDIVNDEESEKDDDDNSEFEEMDVEESSEENNDEVILPKSDKKSVVDDDFFKLHEMEDFLNLEEKKMNTDSGNEPDLKDSDDESEDSVNLFAEDSDESEDGKVRLAKYKEFFVSKEEEKKPKRNKFLEEMSDEDDELDNQQSTLETRHSRLKQKIEEIEERAVSEKPWQLQGEIKADSRPQNSLLEEIVEFDRTSRPAPIITGQTTLQLEDIIKQRIKDKVFDSVERKIKPVDTALEYKKKLVLDQEKSKASLAQIYEKEFLDQQAALDPESAEKIEEEPESHKEIRSLMKTLFNQLDGLSNLHFTPKPAIPELKIISNIPAINMEEVAPVAASDAALLAPEEVKTKPKADILGKSERTITDKNRERRKKKLKQKYHAQEKLKRENNTNVKAKKLSGNITKGNNVEKMDESSGRKSIKSSTAFFNQLQEQVQSQIKTKGESKKKNKNVHDAKKLKL